jgi:hypothetical protein
MRLKTLIGRTRPRGLVLVCLAVSLVGCTSTEQRFAQECRGRGVQDGTDAMAQCVQGERQAAQKAAAQSPTGSAYIPPSFQGTGPGCYNC